jgi:hypothetical protein
MTTSSNDLTREPVVEPAVIVRAGLCLLIMMSGLALRGFGFSLGLSTFVVKYGGSVLWAAMVFFLVAMAASHLPRLSVALISASIAVAVELFRLVQAPWLDAFRLTLPGALLLGRIFSPWNILAYGVGIALAVWLDLYAKSIFGARLRAHAGAR